MIGVVTIGDIKLGTPINDDGDIEGGEFLLAPDKLRLPDGLYDDNWKPLRIKNTPVKRKLIHPRIKSLGYLSDAQMKAIGAGQTPGVPFQGPSGAWFVVRTSDNRVVRAKNPNAAGGGTPAPTPSPTPSPVAIPASATASSLVNKLTSGTPLTATEMSSLPAQLMTMKGAALIQLKRTLNVTAQGGKNSSWAKPVLIAAIVKYAQTLSNAPTPTPLPSVSTPAPAAATPAQNVNNAILKLTNSVALSQAELAQARQDIHQMSDSELDQALQVVLTPSQQRMLPIRNMSTATKQMILDQEILNQQNALPPPATPIAIPNKPGTTGRTPAQNVSPKSKYPMRRSGPATSGKSDRDYRDDLVHAELQKMNIDPANATWSDKMQILSNLQAANLVDSSVDSSNIDIAVTSLISQLATTIIPPLSLYSHGNKRGKNPLAPDGMRPKLSTDQQVAVQNYTGTAYRDLNKSLRDHGTATPRTQKMHQDLQAAFAKTPVLSTPVPLKRAIMLDPAGLAALLSSLQASETAGTPVTFNGYHSCTTKSTTNPNWPDNVIFDIDAIHGLDVKPYSHCPQAEEVILAHDAEFTVAGVTQDPYSGKWHVKLTQLPPAVAGKPPKVKPIKSKWSYLLNSGTTTPATTTPHTTPTDFPSDWTTSKAVQDAITGAKSHTFVTGTGSGHNDTALDDLLVESGRAEKPKIVDKASIDTLQQQGWTVFYRGVSSPQYTKQFRDGSLYNGSGYYGNGTYSHSTEYHKGLSRYAGPGDTGDTGALGAAKGYGSHVLRYAMPPTAKIAKISDMKKEVAKAQAQLKKDYRAGKIKDATQYRKMNDLIADPGRMAALLNYDAIDAETSGYFVILNRSILQVEDKDQ
jgi:hypothetical protein